jgi:hypothetical protein
MDPRRAEKTARASQRREHDRGREAVHKAHTRQPDGQPVEPGRGNRKRHGQGYNVSPLKLQHHIIVFTQG